MTNEEFFELMKDVKISFRANRDYTSLEKMITYSHELENEKEALEEKLRVACGIIMDSHFKGEDRHEWAKQALELITKENP